MKVFPSGFFAFMAHHDRVAPKPAFNFDLTVLRSAIQLMPHCSINVSYADSDCISVFRMRYILINRQENAPQKFVFDFLYFGKLTGVLFDRGRF
jgi:hypothetical protein